MRKSINRHILALGVLAAFLTGCASTPKMSDAKVGTVFQQPAAKVQKVADARYNDNGDGTVTDTATGLMWKKSPWYGKMDWVDAKAYCDNLTYAGYDDWRLPTVAKDGGTAELDTLFRKNGNPSGEWGGVLGTLFASVERSLYWSGTASASYTSDAWFANMYDGSISSGSKTFYNRFYVWPVRGGK
jgi:hypothetical protein